MRDKNIGFIGLGNVGEKIANNILKGNYNLFVNDLKQNKSKKLIKKGAIWCSTMQELANNTSIIITCLPSPSSVNQVLSKLIPFMNSNHLWIEMSTTDESEMNRLSKICLKKKINTLEAPITGGQHRAESGNISIFVGGNKKNYNRAFNLLSLIGYKILYCGKLGNASTLKVVTNYLASINLISIGEALMVCKKYGIDLKTSYNGIKISSGNSFVNETETKVILSGSYDVGFTMDLANKDIGLFNKLANEFQIPIDLGKIINKKFSQGIKKLGKKSFSTSIVKLIENECNIKMRAKNFPKQLIDYKVKQKAVEIK